MQDHDYMNMCIDLAIPHKRATRPNPTVGALIVHDHTIISSGSHLKAGTAHAEAVAIASAGSRASGATLYVTLEPCCHHGRTPPCTDAIIQAGISRVVIGETDPNPEVSGQGISRLQAAGIDVTVMPPYDHIRSLNLPYRKWITSGLPLVTWKFASSLDGKIGLCPGRPYKLSNLQSDTLVHTIRAEHDAIITGIGTITADDPQLTVRHVPARSQPQPIIFDSHARMPVTARIWSSPLPPIIITTNQADPHHISTLHRRGAGVIIVPTVNRRCHVPAALREIGKLNIQSVLLECGGTLAAAFLTADGIDCILSIITPNLIGGTAPTPADNVFPHPLPVTITSQRQLGSDCLITAYPQLQRSDNQCSPESWNEWDRSLASGQLLTSLPS